jgi:hypothetical protein
VIVVGAPTGDLAGLWPLFGLVIETPRLRLRLPREDELPALMRAARDIAGPEGPGSGLGPCLPMLGLAGSGDPA